MAADPHRPPLIELAGVEKVYRTGRVEYRALRGVDLSIAAGELVAVIGPSGSGKSTILNIVTGIDRPTAGTVTFDGVRLDQLNEEELAVWRGANVGIIFQFFQLLPTLTALENATLPLDFLRRGTKRERFDRARETLALVGLADKADHLPAELSGGEQQRVAIARSLAAGPRLVVGDEPTGNLDTVTAGAMLDLLQELNAAGTTILFVTHDRELAARAPRVVEIRDGRVVDGGGWAPVLSASSRKSVTDLWRRRARAVFSVLTLALAVASVFFFAVPTLIDRTMQHEVDEGRLADVALALRPVALDDDQLAALAEVANVAAVEARTSAEVRVLVGDRRAAARLIGVRDLAHQQVDIVRLESGQPPGPGMVQADVQNANVGVYDGDTGDVLTILGDDGARIDVTIAGRARSLPGGEQVQDDNVIVLYAPAATVASVSGQPGYDQLVFRLDDPSPAAAEATVADLRRHLDTVPGFAGLSNLPAIRAPGDWPGRSDTETFSQLLGVITVLALLSAVVLISSTMATLVSDQTREIAVMRALGARRRQIATIYLRTTLLLGALGAVAGAALGIVLSSLLARYFGSEFWAVTVAPGVDVTVLLVGLAVGLVTPSLAALPAIRRAVHVDLREALAASGSALGDQGVLDRVLRRAVVLPRVAQIGLRNVGRRKRRSLATATIVALAVGNLLAVLALAEAATRSSRDSWGNHLEDIQISTGGRSPFDAGAEARIRATPGVAEAEPVLKNTIGFRGREAFLWGVEQDPLFRYRLAAGRWFDEAEAAGAEPVAVIERNIAQNLGIQVGDRVTVTTVVGDADLAVIGVATNQQEDGTALYVPLATARTLVGLPVGARSYWIRADSRDPASIDRVANLIEDRLTAAGHDVSTEIAYVGERDEVAANRTLTTSIAVLGFVIVAMSMVGLANAVTTNVIERTREIGVLRSIGARARHIRWIFGTEGIAVALAGWLLGIPLGYALTRLIVRLIWEIVDVRVPVVFPARNIPIALAGTLLLALAVLGLPVRRATRLRPGDALRYT